MQQLYINVHFINLFRSQRRCIWSHLAGLARRAALYGNNLKWSPKCYNNAAAPAMYVSCKYLYGQKIRLIRGDPPIHTFTQAPHPLTHSHTNTYPLAYAHSLTHAQPSHIHTHTLSYIYSYTLHRDTPQPPTTKSLPRTPLSHLCYPGKPITYPENTPGTSSL